MAFILAAKRTPFGRFGGSLKNLSPTDLGVVAAQAALASINLDPHKIEETFFGTVLPSPEAVYLARHVALKSGCPIEAPALTVNRLCGSGFESVIQGSRAILSGEASLTLCGGTESMSQAPLIVCGEHSRWGVGLGKGMKLDDSLWSGLTDKHANLPMGMTAENLAKKYDISREECDEFALRSHLLWAAGHASGAFDAEIAPVELSSRKGPFTFDTDEHARSDASLEKLSQLPPVFGGVCSAGNSSGISDGAGALVVSSEAAASQLGCTPLARIVSWAYVGVQPEIMGIGPVEAIRQALAKAGLKLDDMAYVEVNEAFAAQYLAVEKVLGLNREVTNVNGGAIALGHPLGASGSRILANLAHKLSAEGNSSKYAVGSACIGGGQGIAVILQGL